MLKRLIIMQKGLPIGEEINLKIKLVHDSILLQYAFQAEAICLVTVYNCYVHGKSLSFFGIKLMHYSIDHSR